jgi:hypothetical protein
MQFVAGRTRRYRALGKAALRLTPRMALFRLRRMARDRYARAAPQAYERRIRAIEGGLPMLVEGQPPSPAGASSGSATEGLRTLYDMKWAGQIDGVACGKFTLLNRTVDFGDPGSIDWHCNLNEGDHQSWRLALSFMGYLCPLLRTGSKRRLDAAAAILDSFERSASFGDPDAFRSFWMPYAASERILAVLAGWLCAEGGEMPEPLAQQIRRRLRRDCAFLLDNIEHELANNHVERNVAALSYYFTHASEAPPRVASRIERDVQEVLRSIILADGCHAERSAMYQALAVISLRVFSEADFLQPQTRELAQERLAAAEHALLALTHPDGEIALFNDAAIGEAPPPAALVRRPLPEGRTMLREGGYARIGSAGDACILDGGPLGMRCNPGHGHADFLSVEISLEGRRLIVDPGTSQYASGPARDRERSWMSHNGPRFERFEPVDFVGSFRVGRMAEARLLDDAALGRLAVSTIGGVLDTEVGRLARIVARGAGGGFLIVDGWRSPTHDPALGFLIPGDWTASVSGNGLNADCGTTRVRITILDGQLAAVGEAPRASRFFEVQSATELTVAPTRVPGGARSLVFVGIDRARMDWDICGSARTVLEAVLSA